jgi:hypothetical protein
MTLALFPSMTATQELVVPKSIPMMLKQTVKRGDMSNLPSEGAMSLVKVLGGTFLQNGVQHLCV